MCNSYNPLLGSDLSNSYSTYARDLCISYYMATSASIWHMRTRDHVITNLLHDNGRYYGSDTIVRGQIM